MPPKQEKIIDLIKNFSPKDFGVRDLYYKAGENEIELLFVVKKSNASSLISYLNSLSDIIEKRSDNIKVISSVYIYDSDRQIRVRKVIERDKLKKIDLISSRYANICP